MSMPKFPEIDPELTCDRALNMILASIAMEELALSHIINAEGEKLKYVLNRLETKCGKKPDVDEILKVNKSITCLMDSISQNQMILKNKMDKAICALSEVCPGSPGPTGPTGPPGPACKSPCKSPCKCSAVFKTAKRCKLWCGGSALDWNTEHRHGACVCIDPCDKRVIMLNSKGRFIINFSVNVRSDIKSEKAAISLQTINNHCRSNIYTVHDRVPADTTHTISMSGIVIENSDNYEPDSIMIKLISPDSLIVEDSILSIIEI